MIEHNVVVGSNKQDVGKLTVQLMFHQLASRTSNSDFHLALLGGSTASTFVDALTKSNDDLSMIHIWFSDERFVELDDPDSNAGQLLERLKQAGIQTKNIHLVSTPSSVPDLQQAANQYQADIKIKLGDNPQFDLILLGLGPDGHTASIFPNETETNSPSDNWIIPVVTDQKKPPQRISFSYQLINNAKHVVILGTGESKAQAIKRAMQEKVSRKEVPLAGVQPQSGELTWILDESAASRLE